MGKVIRRLLIPNRGEIAVRIARGCRENGVTSILAHSADDATSVAARTCDERISLGEGDARKTYLDVGAIIDAAKKTRADAIHPGYGFLSERAELAAACAESEIIFVGPGADAIERMGSKSGARARMEGVGVPVVPGYHGDDQSGERLTAEAARIGFPLLVKASAGGGGKGMKIVHVAGELAGALDSARREAAKAFGNDRLLLERYIEEPRHVEFQVFGDTSGNVIHLFERDCSIQRRHQKIIEETPAPEFSSELRARMASAAVASACGVGYVNAGTVEFILAPNGEFYFLEMNTRLQVEHPVTELVTGVDLLRAQLAVAEGKPLPWKQDELLQRGHAIECRVYAEDPDNGFLPQTGAITHYVEPGGPGIRVDSGVAAGSEVTVKYDPLLAKVIAFAETRAMALDRLDRALREFTILGTTTNISYLRRVIAHPAFRRGEVSTHFIAEHLDALLPPEPGEAASIAAVLAAAARRPSRATSAKSAAVPSVSDIVGSWGR
ncbi:MAG: acetyl-CoA carboxylase biotin carboxylase subunit [Thermoanaerobaculia bacterium]